MSEHYQFNHQHLSNEATLDLLFNENLSKSLPGDSITWLHKRKAQLPEDGVHKMRTHSSERDSSGSSNEQTFSALKTDLLARKKPGRKPIEEEDDSNNSNKRKAQNRAAQRAFRERKEQYVKNLENRVKELETMTNQLSESISVKEQPQAETINSGWDSSRLERLKLENLRLKEVIKKLKAENETLKSQGVSKVQNPEDKPLLDFLDSYQDIAQNGFGNALLNGSDDLYPSNNEQRLNKNLLDTPPITEYNAGNWSLSDAESSVPQAKFDTPISPESNMTSTPRNIKPAENNGEIPVTSFEPLIAAELFPDLTDLTYNSFTDFLVKSDIPAQSNWKSGKSDSNAELYSGYRSSNVEAALENYIDDYYVPDPEKGKPRKVDLLALLDKGNVVDNDEGLYAPLQLASNPTNTMKDHAPSTEPTIFDKRHPLASAVPELGKLSEEELDDLCAQLREKCTAAAEAVRNQWHVQHNSKSDDPVCDLVRNICNKTQNG